VAIVLRKASRLVASGPLEPKGAGASQSQRSRASRYDEIEELLHEQFGVLTHSNLLRSTGLPLAAIDAEHFQVRRIPQLTTAELAETKRA